MPNRLYDSTSTIQTTITAALLSDIKFHTTPINLACDITVFI